MLKLVIASCLLALGLAHPHGDYKHHKENGNGNGAEPTKRVHGGVITPWVPFPHYEDFAIYKVGKQAFLPGTAFTAVKADGTCHRIMLTDEMGGHCPLNQTVCDQISATLCTPQQANVTCFESPKPGATAAPGTPTQVPEGEFGNGHLHGGPLCHVLIDGQKFQPSAYTAIFTLMPKIATCVFQVAPPPTVYPEPTGEPMMPKDPYCPFMEH